jgi:hypothetical protein
LNPKQFESVLKGKLAPDQIQLVYHLLLDSLKEILSRESDFVFDLEYFGEFTKKNGKLIYRSYDTVHINDIYLKHEMKEKQAKRANYFKGLKKKKHKDISSMVFKLVNLPTLFEEESEYLQTQQSKKKQKTRGRIRRSKTQILKPIKQRQHKSPGNARLLGTRGCLRSRKLAPLKYFKNNFAKDNTVFKKTFEKLENESEVKVIEEFSRTLAKPAGVLGECLSVSGRIGSNYTPLSRYLHVDLEKKQIRYYKLEETCKENKENASLEPLLKQLDINITNNCGLNMDLFPSRKEIDIFHSLQLKNKNLMQQKVVSEIKDEDTMIILEENDRNKLEILRLKTKNHQEMLKKYREIVSTEIPQKVVFPISNQFLEDIFTRVEINLKSANRKYLEAEVDKLVAEIKKDYYWNIKKAILDYILKDRKQQNRLGIKLIDFSNIREWGEKDLDCVIQSEDAKAVEKLGGHPQLRNSVLIKSEVKNMIHSRFSIINDGKMRKSTFSMLNKKNQIGSPGYGVLVNNKSFMNSNGEMRKSGFRKLSKNKISIANNVYSSSNDKNQISKEKISKSRSRKSITKSTKTISKQEIPRENFRSRVDKLQKKLVLFNPAMKEIKTIRAYFKYSFDLRDKIIINKAFDIEYKSIDDLIKTPKESLSQDWGDFINENLDRLEKFKSIVIPSWMQEISNVYQKSILGEFECLC